MIYAVFILIMNRFQVGKIGSYVILRPGWVCCPGKCVLTAQCKCFMRFGMRDVVHLPRWMTRFVPKLETLNPRTEINPKLLNPKTKI